MLSQLSSQTIFSRMAADQRKLQKFNPRENESVYGTVMFRSDLAISNVRNTDHFTEEDRESIHKPTLQRFIKKLQVCTGRQVHITGNADHAYTKHQRKYKSARNHIIKHTANHHTYSTSRTQQIQEYKQAQLCHRYSSPLAITFCYEASLLQWTQAALRKAQVVQMSSQEVLQQ